MNKLISQKTRAQEILENFYQDKTNTGMWDDPNYAKEYAVEHAVKGICALLDDIISKVSDTTAPSSCRGSFSAENNNVSTLVTTIVPTYYPTYEKSYSCGNPSMAEGYPCPSGTRVVILNKNTHQLEITNFDPESLTTDWEIIYQSDYDAVITDDNAKYFLKNLLSQMGWYK